jgi:hypothetical protein
MSTAVECVREIFPDSAVQTKRVDNPFRVMISIQLLGDKQPMKVWACKQHNLFQRNPKRRRLAMDSMRSALARIKEQVSFGTLPIEKPRSPMCSTASSTEQTPNAAPASEET